VAYETLLAAPPNPARPDDLSGDAHRRLIGWIGLLLPALLVVIAIERDGLARWRSLESISAYYYTGALAAFVGMLVALALFLFTYRGFDNPHHKADRAVAIVAGLAALAVAFFPTAAPAGVPPLAWWTRSTGVIHHLAAVVLFAMFAVFALWLFRLRKDGKTETTGWRNKVYLACGVAIVACIVWAGYNGYTGREIFVPESIALIAFSFSWLVKGYAVEMLVDKARRFLQS
jgi:succinate dehydrogenase/fumarate reductase cytochrome b subunit